MPLKDFVLRHMKSEDAPKASIKSSRKRSCKNDKENEAKEKKIRKILPEVEEGVVYKGTPDYLEGDIDLVMIGFNPGLFSGECGHHYSGRNNQFYKLLIGCGLSK